MKSPLVTLLLSGVVAAAIAAAVSGGFAFYSSQSLEGLKAEIARAQRQELLVYEAYTELLIIDRENSRQAF